MNCWRCGASPNSIYLDEFGLKCWHCGYLQDQEKVKKITEAKAKHDITRRTYWGDYKTRKRGRKRKEENLDEI